MREESSFFVKLNCKNIDSLKSLIVDRRVKDINKSEKYIMCAGKYDKNGWTLVFRANTYKEAEQLANLNPFEYRKSKLKLN